MIRIVRAAFLFCVVLSCQLGAQTAASSIDSGVPVRTGISALVSFSAAALQAKAGFFLNRC